MVANMQRKAINIPVRKSELIQVKGTEKVKGRHKMTLVKLVKKDI
jgi:hypothetical protein